MLPYPSFLRIIVSGATAAIACTAQAQQADVATTADTPHAWGIGIGVGVERSPYRDFGNKTTALPLLFYNSERFRLAGTTADLKLGSTSSFDFTLRAKYSNDGYKSGDASILNGMEERKDGIWLGASATWRAPFAKLTTDWLKDASGNSGGQTIRLGIERGLTTGRLRFTPHLGVAWVNSDYVDYYYGVRPSEATASRAAYNGKSTVNTILGLRTDYSLTNAQSLFLDLRVTRYGSAIADSPLVDRSTLPSVRLGYLYQF